jgi:hypothetical protein
MSHIDPDRLVRALRDAGLTVKGYGDWQHRTSAGGWNPRGIVNHHTASAASAATQDRLLAHGRPGIPGPLCHITITRTGVVRMIGWGNANHAGLGDSRTLKAVLSSNADLIPSHPDRTNTDGNVSFYGIEVQNDGRGETYPRKQLHALMMTNAVIHKLHGWDENSSIHHKEWTSRKVDMSWAGGKKLRSAVRDYLHGNFIFKDGTSTVASRIPNTTADTTETDSSMSIWDEQITVPWGTKDNPDWKASNVLVNAAVHARAAHEGVNALNGKIDALAAAVAGIEPGTPAAVNVDLNALAEAVADKLAERMAN